MTESAVYPPTGLRGLVAAWLRAPLERAYLEGFTRSTEYHRELIRQLERELNRR